MAVMSDRCAGSHAHIFWINCYCFSVMLGGCFGSSLRTITLYLTATLGMVPQSTRPVTASIMHIPNAYTSDANEPLFRVQVLEPHRSLMKLRPFLKLVLRAIQVVTQLAARSQFAHEERVSNVAGAKQFHDMRMLELVPDLGFL